jgi:hypothetical protein
MADTKNKEFVAGDTIDNAEPNVGRNGHTNGHNNSNGSTADQLQDEQATRLVTPVSASTNSNGNGNGSQHSNGNGNGNGHTNGYGNTVDLDRVGGVRPVRARVGNTGRLGSTAVNANGYSNGNGTGALNSTGKLSVAAAIAHEQKARINFDNDDIASTNATVVRPTAPLRESDLAELRLRLKTQEWPAALPLTPGKGKRRRSGKRPLPPFLMRHRQLRSRSRVGNTRSQAAIRRHGKGGATSVIAYVMVLLLMFSRRRLLRQQTTPR